MAYFPDAWPADCTNSQNPLGKKKGKGEKRGARTVALPFFAMEVKGGEKGERRDGRKLILGDKITMNCAAFSNLLIKGEKGGGRGGKPQARPAKALSSLSLPRRRGEGGKKTSRAHTPFLTHRRKSITHILGERKKYFAQPLQLRPIKEGERGEGGRMPPVLLSFPRKKRKGRDGSKRLNNPSSSPLHPI